MRLKSPAWNRVVQNVKTIGTVHTHTPGVGPGAKPATAGGLKAH